MNPKNFLKYIAICLFMSNLSYGQQDFLMALYNYHRGLYNPAAIGTQAGSFVNTSFRSQWFGIKDAPRIQAITLGFPTGEKRAGYGLLFTNDQTFIERQTKFFATYTYRLSLSSVWDLHLGLSAGGNNFAVNHNQLDNLQSTSDGSFQNYSRFNPNMGLGAYLKKENFYFSIALPQVLATKRYKDQEAISTSARDRQHLYLMSGFRQPLKGDWSWINSALVRYVQAAPLAAVFNTGVGYKSVEASLGYQIKAGFTGTLMICESDARGMAMGYSYQMPTAADLKTLTGGNHEILLRIRLGREKTPAEIIEEEAIDETEVGLKTIPETK